MRIPLSLVVALLLVLSSGPTRADIIERGLVVRIEDREIYFNLGRATGLARGDRLRIKRLIKLRHPVTGKMVSDWLPIGSATVTETGSKLTMAILAPDLLAQVKVGDILETLIEREEIVSTEPEPEPEPPPTPDPTPEVDRPLPEVPTATREVLLVWQATAGKSIEARIAAWEGYLARNPDSPFAATLHEDLDILRALRERLRPTELSLEDHLVSGLDHSAPTRSLPNQAVELVFLVEDPSTLAAAWLHYRARGAASFKKATLASEGEFYLRGSIPAAAVAGPGVEYFVEIATHSGDVGTAVGSPDDPNVVVVESAPLTERFTDRVSRSRMSVRSTFIDFATFDARSGDHTDAFFLFEADFLYRLRGPIYGIRSGLGVISGKGGLANAVYTDAEPAQEAGFNYGYTELEVRGPARTAFRGRLVAGAGRDGFGLGVEGRFRIGHEDDTNLSLGASKIAEIGFLTDIRMQWDAVANVPIGLAVAVTDQPNRGDLGVRLTTDVGWNALPWLQPTLRLSYQARTVVHSGLGVGLGLVFDW